VQEEPEVSEEVVEDEEVVEQEEAVEEEEEVVEDEVVEEEAADEGEENDEEAGAEEGEEEAAGEAEDDADEESADDHEGLTEIDVVYNKRLAVRGPRNGTLQLIQEKTGVEPITECGGTFRLRGVKSARREALQAIEDIVNKGYTLFSWDDGVEEVVEVPADKIGALIGPKGSVIKKLEETFRVKLKLPDASAAPSRSAKMEALVAGSGDKVEACVQVVREILDNGFSPLTHPGTKRTEIDVDAFQKPFLIGKKGVEIKKVKEKFNVRVDLTDDGRTVVMGPKKQVDDALVHIADLLKSVEEKVQANREKAEKVAAEAAAAKAEEEAARAEAEGKAEEGEDDPDADVAC